MRFGSAWPQANIALIDKTSEIAPGIHLICVGLRQARNARTARAVAGHRNARRHGARGRLLAPGIDNIVKAAAAINRASTSLPAGFIWWWPRTRRSRRSSSTLRDTYKVAYVAPGHCTGEPTFTALRKAFGERYLYAGLGSTLALGGIPRTLGAGAIEASPALEDSELLSYHSLYLASNDRRRAFFGHLQAMGETDGAYLAEWRRARVGCC